MEKPARWMASGVHLFQPLCPFTFPVFSVGIMLSCLMARPDALNLLAFTTCCMDWRLNFPFDLIFNLTLGFRSTYILSRFLGINAKISAALSNTAPSPALSNTASSAFRFLDLLKEGRRSWSAGIKDKSALGSAIMDNE